MPKDLSQIQWRGIPRKEIPWFLTVARENSLLGPGF